MSYQLAGRTLHGAGLAPMAGLTDLALRRIADAHGAAFTVSEMVSAKALVMGDDKTRTLCTHTGGSGLYGIQLFGSEPDVMEEAAAIVAGAFSPDFLDLNLGCPAPKIAGNGAGSALMRDPELCGRLVEAIVKAGLPVTVKMRTGYDADHLNARRWPVPAWRPVLFWWRCTAAAVTSSTPRPSTPSRLPGWWRPSPYRCWATAISTPHRMRWS